MSDYYPPGSMAGSGIGDYEITVNVECEFCSDNEWMDLVIRGHEGTEWQCSSCKMINTYYVSEVTD